MGFANARFLYVFIDGTFCAGDVPPTESANADDVLAVFDLEDMTYFDGEGWHSIPDVEDYRDYWEETLEQQDDDEYDED